MSENRWQFFHWQTSLIGWVCWFLKDAWICLRPEIAKVGETYGSRDLFSVHSAAQESRLILDGVLCPSKNLRSFLNFNEIRKCASEVLPKISECISLIVYVLMNLLINSSTNIAESLKEWNRKVEEVQKQTRLGRKFPQDPPLAKLGIFSR